MAISNDDLERITQQSAVLDADGDRLGTVDQVYTSDSSGDPAWVTVRTGQFGSEESFVPLSDASFDGDDVRVSVTKEAVHGAPRVDAGGHLSVEEEDDLYRYYGLTNPDHDPDDVADAATGTVHGDPDREDADHGAETDDADRTALAGAGAATGAAAAVGGDQRDDDLAARDADGRDEVAFTTEAAPRRADGGDDDRDRGDDDRTVAAENGPELAEPASGPSGEGQENGVEPGERTTRLRRYVVTERVVQTIEELPDDDPR